MLRSRKKHLLLAYPADLRQAAQQLSEIYHLLNFACTVVEYNGRPPQPAFYTTVAPKETDAVLVMGKKSYAPSTVLPGPFLTLHNKQIPAAWLPLRKMNDLEKFIQVLQKVHKRCQVSPTMALLAQWHPQYLRLTRRMNDLLENKIPVFNWTGDIITREAVVNALGAGLGMGIYFGHGRPVGWVGYYGMRAYHFNGFNGSPLGCMMSLCCKTASRKRTGLSYSEALPLMGVSAASFGAVCETKHSDNMKWAINICTALNRGVDNLGDLLLLSAPADSKVVEHYRIIGDPFAPLYAEAASRKRAKTVHVLA